MLVTHQCLLLLALDHGSRQLRGDAIPFVEHGHERLNADRTISLIYQRSHLLGHRGKADSLLLMLNMACTLFRLTPEEALAGVTRHAAQALGLKDRGVLAPGMRADFVLWDVAHPAQLAYALGANPLIQTVFEGQVR